MLLTPGHTVAGNLPGFVIQVSVKNPISTSTAGASARVIKINVKLAMDNPVTTAKTEYNIKELKIFDDGSGTRGGRRPFLPCRTIFFKTKWH